MLAIFMDLETTGLDPSRHRVIELAIKAIDIQRGSVVGAYQTIIKQPHEVWERRDSFSIEINGFQWSQLQNGVEEAEVGHRIVNLFRELKVERGKAVYICQNPAFDRSFFSQIVDLYTQDRLNWPYHWLDLASMYWALKTERYIEERKSFPDSLSLSKDEIAKQYNLPKEAAPHRAMNGVDHLILCYRAIFANLPAKISGSP